MVIHRVQVGETLTSIAEMYGVPASRIISDNELKNPDELVVGQTLVILYPDRVYLVKEGDTLLSIAQAYNVSVNQLWRNNPILKGETNIYPGQILVIDYQRPGNIPQIAINGYAYPFIDTAVLRQTLPYLTYLTVFTYGFTPEGELIVPEDDEIIALAREYGVAPIMLISTLTDEGVFSNELAHTLLNDEAIQDVLIQNILDNLREKNYYGLDIDFEYILPEDKDAYTAFVKKITERLNAEGYPVIVALAPKTSGDQPGLLYEAHDYGALGNAANSVLLMTYEWGYRFGPPMAVAPIDKVREVLDYAVTVIDPSKIFMGIPNYGYDWKLPFVRGESDAKTISNVGAVEQAVEVGTEIEYDPISQAPFYVYTSPDDGAPHEVWFEDADSIAAKLDLTQEYGLQGASYWNIMNYFPQNWLVLNALYNIARIE